MKAMNSERRIYVPPRIAVVAVEQCLMQTFSKWNPGSGDGGITEGNPSNPKLAPAYRPWTSPQEDDDED